MRRALDLFCGAAGGWSLGLHRAGLQTVAACEIDPWRRETFARNNPSVKMYDDVKTLTADRLAADGVVPEIVVGSPPCQDASLANSKGKGVDGERTGLFFEAVRLVRELRPVWACFENVPGLRTRGYDRVHDELEAAGYAVQPLVVGAWHAGAPHRRNRVWIIAVANEPRWANECFGRGRTQSGDACSDSVAYARQRERLTDLRERQGSAARPTAPNSRIEKPNDLVAVSTQEQVGRAGLARQEVERASANTAGIGFGARWPRGFASSDARQPEQAFQDAHASLMQRPSITRGQSDGVDAIDAADASGTDAAGRSENGGRSGWRSLLAAWKDWNGGPPDLGGVDDGLPKGLARKSLSAYGDAVVPLIPELIARTMQRMVTTQ